MSQSAALTKPKPKLFDLKHADEFLREFVRTVDLGFCSHRL